MDFRRLEHFIDQLLPPDWLVSLEKLWAKLCLQRDDYIDQILTSSCFKWHFNLLISCFSSISKLTHDVQSLLRDPADVHVVHATGALFYFHWQPLPLQGE